MKYIEKQLGKAAVGSEANAAFAAPGAFVLKSVSNGQVLRAFLFATFATRSVVLPAVRARRLACGRHVNCMQAET